MGSVPVCVARISLALGLVVGVPVMTLAQVQVSASDAWIVTPVAGATTAVAAVTIRNPTMYDVYVISAVSDAAGRIEFREAAPAGGEAKAVKELTVPAFGSLDLSPQGIHALLIDLKQPLKTGDTVTITLSTDAGVALKVTAPVKPTS